MLRERIKNAKGKLISVKMRENKIEETKLGLESGEQKCGGS